MYLSIRVLFSFFFFFMYTATTEIYTLSLHDALPIWIGARGKELADDFDVMDLDGADQRRFAAGVGRVHIGTIFEHGQRQDRKSTRLNSSHVAISYAVFCLKKKKKKKQQHIA